MPLDSWRVVASSGMVFNTFFGFRRLGPTVVPDATTGMIQEQDPLYPPGLLPLSGTGSLQIRGLLSGATGNIFRINESERGITSGSITSIWWAAVSTVAGSGVTTGGIGFGYYCYADQTDLRNNGSVYLIGCTDAQFSGSTYTYDIFLSKSSTGVAGYSVGSNLLIRRQNNRWPLQDFFTLRVNWQHLTASTITFDVYRGTNPDLSDFVHEFTYTDTDPLSVTVAEGFWGGTLESRLLKVFADTTIVTDGVIP